MEGVWKQEGQVSVRLIYYDTLHKHGQVLFPFDDYAISCMNIRPCNGLQLLKRLMMAFLPLSH